MNKTGERLDHFVATMDIREELDYIWAYMEDETVLQFIRRMYKRFEKKRNVFEVFIYYHYPRGRCGIEILGMTPKRTRDDKYSWDGGWKTVKDLKEACKKNGIKNYSRFSKSDMITALMRI